MADRRGLRAANRRKTPTPQPTSKATTPQVGRASRARGLRSASRDIENITHAQKPPTRRSARQASVTTVTDESDQEGRATRRTKRKLMKEPVGDLATVDELDTQIALEDIPETSPRTQLENEIPYRSPGAASEMSGTTAISSFVENDPLEPKYILKHLRKLCESTEEYLQHLAPDNANFKDDLDNIREIQKPGSDFAKEYQDFDTELNVHLKHFKNDQRDYIHIRAIHRALFGLNQDIAAAQSGLDLILYLTNLLIFAKNMIHSDRNAKDMWNALRQLDTSFPSNFMRSLVFEEIPTAAGESALLDDTFALALDLRTQLAILVLRQSINGGALYPADVLIEVFIRPEASQVADDAIIRGWNVSALGGDDSALPQQFQNNVKRRLDEMREFVSEDDKSIERGDVIDLEGLSEKFPWEPIIMRLLHWVRLRHRELRGVMHKLGGPAAIWHNVKQAIEESPTVVEQVGAASSLRNTRKKRTSFGRDRRRSSRKFDPNAPVDLRAIDVLKARERDSGVHFDLGSTRQDHEERVTPQAVGEAQKGPPTVSSEQDNRRPVLGEDDEPPENMQIEEVEEQVEEPAASGPPKSSADLINALNAVSKPQKENRPVSLFDRQPTAQRVEFGEGFDETQPTPGPSNKANGKRRVQTPSRKRPRPVEVDEDSDDEAFQTEERGARVQERRLKAPIAKKVRIDPVSSGAPPSHQPPPRRELDNGHVSEQREQEESVSEAEAPDMTEEVPSSIYNAQRRLAQQNSVLVRASNERKVRTAWSHAEENAFIEYMAIYPRKYSTILQHDRDQGGRRLQNRTQVNLKDKARTMAINMIKSGTGLSNGFEEVVNPLSRDGQTLLDRNFAW